MGRERGLALIADIHRAVHAVGLAISDATGITQAEALVLTLLRSRESTPLEDVHKAFLHRRSTLTNVLERLESRRLITRQASPLDRRRFDISLTPTGRKKANQVTTLLTEILESGEISENEAAAALRTLAKVVEGSAGKVA